jgi:hypothetical protein
MRPAPETETGGEDDHEAGELPGFIHLRDARVFAADGQSELPGTLWRGRLDQVSDWSIGTFARSH